MNRFVIVDGLPYLLAHGKTYSVRWDEKGFTVGAEVMLASVPARTFSELSVRAKCAGHLDSILAPGATQDKADNEEPEQGEVGQCPTNAGDCLQSASVASAADAVMADKELDEMTVAELKAVAEQQGIDLGNAKKKADILKAIRAVLY